MPRPRKKTIQSTSLPLTVEMSESLLEAVLLKTLQPLYGEIATMKQKNDRVQRQITDSIAAQADTQILLRSLSKQVLSLLAQQTKLAQILTSFSESSTNDDIGNSLEKLKQCSDHWEKVLGTLSAKLDSTKNSQQALTDSLASFSQSLASID